MEIGTVKADKKLKIYTIKGKRVDREDFQLGAMWARQYRLRHPVRI